MDSAQGLTTEMSIHQAIARLEEISWKLNAKVFGERPTGPEEQKVPDPEDKVTQAREKIVEITKRLEAILHGLRNL